MAILTGCYPYHPGIVTHDAHLSQREITKPTAVLDEQGRLVEAGWAKHPHPQFDPGTVQANRKQLRQWDYYYFLSDTLLIEITVANIRFAAFCSVMVRDIRDPQNPVSTLASRGKLRIDKVIGELPNDQEGDVRCVGGDQQTVLHIYRDGNERVFDIDFQRAILSRPIKGQLRIQDDPMRDSYVGVFPFTELDRGFFYENKVPGMQASGSLVADGKTYDLPQDTFAVRDWGRGVWPKKLVWQWGMAGGRTDDGRRIDFNLGAGFGDVSKGTENIIFVDGKAHKLGIVNWDFDRDDLTADWNLSSPDNRFAATLTTVVPDRLGGPAIIGKGIKILKTFGHLSGQAILDDGSIVTFQKLRGFLEEVYIRW